jgi:hypothetical protein
MSDIADLTAKGLPSSQALLKATAVALLVAALVLMFVVLPAEYGVDPTGVGSRIGLTAMSDPDAADAADAESGELIEPTNTVESSAAPISVLDAVFKAEQPFRTDEMSVTLQPNEGGEIKALMQVGERMMFSWVTEGGGVNFDMHGEELNAGKDEFTSYWKGRNETSGHGAFQAPFAGTHGWYWRNRGSAPVTVRVKTSGYYEKLFRP